MSILCHRGSVRRDEGMEENREIGVVVAGKIKTCNLCITYLPVFIGCFCFLDNEGQER